MTNSIGLSTTYSTILPNNAALSRIRPVNLSKRAKFRLRGPSQGPQPGSNPKQIQKVRVCIWNVKLLVAL
jgi:hypothetical protein